MKPATLKSAMAAAMGITALATSPVTLSGVVTASWSGYFLMLDPYGYALANPSLPSKTNNQYTTPISGTLTLDDVSGAGSMSVASFDFLGNVSTWPGQLRDIQLQIIGDGMGGPGSLILGNMMFDWNGNVGMPVSVVLDATGLLGADLTSVGTTVTGTGATPATDGTYIGAVLNSMGLLDANGYLAMGPMPMVTTAWNTSFAPGCAPDNCMGVNPSGILPLVLDDTQNQNDYLANTGAQPGTWGAWGEVYGIGGSPMLDGPFPYYNINLNFETITITDYEVPLPAAAWLLGSGLLGLLGCARRRRKGDEHA